MLDYAEPTPIWVERRDGTIEKYEDYAGYYEDACERLSEIVANDSTVCLAWME